MKSSTWTDLTLSLLFQISTLFNAGIYLLHARDGTGVHVVQVCKTGFVCGTGNTWGCLIIGNHADKRHGDVESEEVEEDAPPGSDQRKDGPGGAVPGNVLQFLRWKEKEEITIDQKNVNTFKSCCGLWHSHSTYTPFIFTNSFQTFSRTRNRYADHCAICPPALSNDAHVSTFLLLKVVILRLTDFFNIWRWSYGV